jgi:hypothetical protein
MIEIVWTERMKNEIILRVKKETAMYIQENKGRITGLVTSFVRTAFYKTVLKQR